MLVGTEADVIVVELGFTVPQHFLGQEECSLLSVSGQTFLGQFASAIVLIRTGNIRCRYFN